MSDDFINIYLDKTNEELFGAIRDRNILKSQVALLEKKLMEVNSLNEILLQENEKLKEKKNKKTSDG